MKRALTALALAAVVASVLPLAATAWWGFDLFTHFRVQLLAGLALLAAAFALSRGWRWIALLAACFAVNAWPLIPYMPLGAGAIAGGDPALTVLTANVRARNEKHAGLVASIAATNPDVVLIVEFTERWREYLAPAAGAYPHRFQVLNDGNFGIALWSRHPFVAVAALDLGPTTGIDAVVETPAGPVRMLGVHLLPPISSRASRDRNSQLAMLAEHIAASDVPLVITGDFNLSPYSPYFTAWRSRTGLKDARAGRGLDFTWPSFFPLLGIPIDHCLVSSEFAVAEYRRLDGFGSDHYPILVSLVQERAR